MPLISTVETRSRLPQTEGMMAEAALGIQWDFAMPPPKTARFPRSARLLRHADFERVYKQGRRHFSASMTVFYWPRPAKKIAEEEGKTRVGAASAATEGRSEPHGLRIGFTVGRALGGAVQRNRMKRRLREAVRLTLPAAKIAADVVINPKKSLLTIDFPVVLNEVTRAFAVIEQKLAPRTQGEALIDPKSTRRKPEAGGRV